MRKGVSPVVAIVLLIAIAVISAVAVWSWVAPLTGKPPTGSTTQYIVSVKHCYPEGNTIDLRNDAALTITSQNFSLVDTQTGAILNASGAFTSLLTIAPGATSSNVAVAWDIVAGSSYTLRAQNFPDHKFVC